MFVSLQRNKAMICNKIFYLCYWWNCIDNFILECTVRNLLRYDYDHSLDLYKIVVVYVPFMKYIRKRDTIESNCPCTNSNNLEGNVKRDHSYKKQTNNTYLSISWSCADIDILRYRCLFFKRKSLCCCPRKWIRTITGAMSTLRGT